ncbi:MAG: nucleotidyl transferase AbiEii/AbiGii toxin family protein [Gammaproteobacteria bacterium]|nr:nucleotidyl transferase AbiEii/AbiGii toxin family protein [Gammaproteobacteria bacterium]MDH5799543.1 nucleotidyl transferase AbiEii/AbiGii toxin family protein [Gammaproteobacteria bacterium]
MIQLIQQRLREYKTIGPIEEENALKEIVQEIILFALWRAEFFEVAAFQGGTSLRILYGLPRFSEDIDFVLQQPDSDFSWQPYLDSLTETCMEFGIEPEALDRKQMDRNVRAAVIKDTSIANQLNLNFLGSQSRRKLTIKLEVDCNPPVGSGFEYNYLSFPVDYEVCHQDMSSNFALKIHALLCRPYLKGRDWYDFNWYVAKGVTPNIGLLNNALIQYGPWKGKNLNIDKAWLTAELEGKIAEIKWDRAAQDVERFLKPVEQKSLTLWSERFFLSKLRKLV